jgi:hypothetical protein
VKTRCPLQTLSARYPLVPARDEHELRIDFKDTIPLLREIATGKVRFLWLPAVVIRASVRAWVAQNTIFPSTAFCATPTDICSSRLVVLEKRAAA